MNKKIKYIYSLVLIALMTLNIENVKSNNLAYDSPKNNINRYLGYSNSIIKWSVVDSNNTKLQFIDSKKSLALIKNKYYKVKPNKKISMNSGTISLWIKPLWKEDQNKSHTFLSMQWDNDKHSYMALSQGWWEPTGKDRLYFIVNNQEELACYTKNKLNVNEWTHVTVTWGNGENGFCKIYIDGEKVANYSKSISNKNYSKDSFYLGIDKGASNSKGRTANSEIRKLLILNKYLTDSEVGKSFKLHLENGLTADQKNLKWMQGLIDDKAGIKQQISKNYTQENRVIFDENYGWAVSKNATDKILHNIKRAGFNVYIPCVWHGKGSYYPTELTYPDKRLKQRIRNDDPLKYLIEKAHQMGIEVHPWFTVVRREDDSYPMYYDEGTPDMAFNVHNKSYREFIIELMLDVVKRYPVDGINLDYIRSMGFCKSKECIDEYKKKYGGNLKLDLILRRVSRKQELNLMKWNLEAVSSIVENFSTLAKAIRPDLIISVDAHPLHNDLLLQGQDSVLWANNEWVDVIFNMDYKKRIDVTEANKVINVLDNPKKMIMLFSLYDRVDTKKINRSLNIINKYIELSRTQWPAKGVAFYQYPELTNTLITGFRDNVFKDNAVTVW